MRRAAEKAVAIPGGFDTWINNAGISIFERTWDVPIADWHRMFETVYWGVAYGSLQALKHFRTTGRSGAIISAGSFFGDRTPPVQSTYLR